MIQFYIRFYIFLRYIFNIDVPERPAHWMISAFSVSPSKGFGMLQRAIEYVGVLPFFINVEMPDKCRQGEQVGIRVSVFNYMLEAIEATVVLEGSSDYKFVHVEEDGVVSIINISLCMLISIICQFFLSIII